MKKYSFSLNSFLKFAFLLSIFSWSVIIWATPKTFSLDGRLYSKDSSSSPILDPQVTIKIQILNPIENCILYEESQVVNTQSTNGYFNVQVGSSVSGSGSSKRSSGDSGNSMANVFSNSNPSISGKSLTNLANCSYIPASGDQRYARISATPSNDQVTRVFSPNMNLDSVPNAVIAESAESFKGMGVNQFLQVNDSSAQLTQANLEALFMGSAYTNLQNVLNGIYTVSGNSSINTTGNITSSGVTSTANMSVSATTAATGVVPIIILQHSMSTALIGMDLQVLPMFGLFKTYWEQEQILLQH